MIIMDYFNALSSQLSIELVSHVILLVLCGSLATRIFGAGSSGVEHNVHIPHLVFGACMLYAMSTILSFFVDRGSSSYMVFISLYMIGVYGAFAILFWTSRELHGNHLTLLYFMLAFVFSVGYTAIGAWQFHSKSNSHFLWYVLSEVSATVFLFIFVHHFLAQLEQLHENLAKK